MNPFIAIIIIAVVYLQFILSRQPKKFLGLMLPLLSFLMSIVVCICFSFSVNHEKEYTITLHNGDYYSFTTVEEFENFKDTLFPDDIASENLVTNGGKNASPATYFLSVLKLGAGVNLMTAVLLLIYVSQSRIRKNRQNLDIQKTIIQDV